MLCFSSGEWLVSRGAFGSSMLVALRIAGSVGGEMMIVGLFVCVSLGFCARSQWRIFCLLLLSVPDVPGSEVELGTSFVFLAFLSLAERLMQHGMRTESVSVRPVFVYRLLQWNAMNVIDFTRFPYTKFRQKSSLT